MHTILTKKTSFVFCGIIYESAFVFLVVTSPARLSK